MTLQLLISLYSRLGSGRRWPVNIVGSCLAAFVLVHCGPAELTGIDLTIRFATGLGVERLDQVEISVHHENGASIGSPKLRPEEPRNLASPQTIFILVSDELDGQELVVRVKGLKDGVETGRAGEVTTKIEAGRRAREEVFLDFGGCELPGGLTAEHGDDVTLYRGSGDGEERGCCPRDDNCCEAMTVTCDNGELRSSDGLSPSIAGFNQITCGATGHICDDGSIFAGTILEGPLMGHHYYTTASDMPAGQAAREHYEWSADPDETPPPAVFSEYRGSANTTALTNDSADFPAAEACFDLRVHAHGDWFLPAKKELELLYQGREAVGGFNQWSSPEHESLYWSSTGQPFARAWAISFETGDGEGYSQDRALLVRCVRMESPQEGR